MFLYLNLKIYLKKVLNAKLKMEKNNCDSVSMMNKVFEVIEAKNIFNLDINKISILIDPSSYIHSIKI